MAPTRAAALTAAAAALLLLLLLDVACQLAWVRRIVGVTMMGI